MNTKKPISTISYNSKEFLERLLNDLIASKKIAFWSAILHQGEILDDGYIEKDHFHVYIEPHKQVDTMDIQEASKEYDPKYPDKPLKCINFRPSDWDNWVWYNLHDTVYLMSKGEQRQYQYSKEDFIYSDEDEFQYRFERALHSGTVAKNLKIRKMMNNYSVSQLCAIGLIAPEKALAYSVYEKQVRNGLAEEQIELDRINRIRGEQLRREQLAKPIE